MCSSDLIAPDMGEDDIRMIARVAIAQKMDAIVATNTTLARDQVRQLAHGQEEGGLSGAPLRERATEVIAQLARALDGALPIIGVGGVTDVAGAAEKLDAGATLVQVYSGMIYRGPFFAAKLARGLADRQLA